MLALSAMNSVQEILTNEDPEIDRPDMWDFTWAELQIPPGDDLDQSQHLNRQVAYNQIYALYMNSLETLYPHLKDISSGEELMIDMMMIDDLPQCNGVFTASEYMAEDGQQRAMSCTEVILGEHMAMAVFIIDYDTGLTKSYSLNIGVGFTLWGGSNIDMGGNDAEEDQMMSKIHPSQISNLLRIIHGNMEPYEVESRLIEIQMLSQNMTDVSELNQIIDYARTQYPIAVERHALDIENGGYSMNVNDLNEIHSIINERNQQLKS